MNEFLFTKQHSRIIFSHYLPLDSAFEIAKTMFVNYTGLICTQVIELKLKVGKTVEREEVVPIIYGYFMKTPEPPFSILLDGAEHTEGNNSFGFQMHKAHWK